MLNSQTNALELVRDASEAVWGVVSILILVALVLAVAASIVWVKRAAARRRELELRVERLEEGFLEDR